jgi:hypothetical protein
MSNTNDGQNLERIVGDFIATLGKTTSEAQRYIEAIFVGLATVRAHCMEDPNAQSPTEDLINLATAAAVEHMCGTAAPGPEQEELRTLVFLVFKRWLGPSGEDEAIPDVLDMLHKLSSH